MFGLAASNACLLQVEHLKLWKARAGSMQVCTAFRANFLLAIMLHARTRPQGNMNEPKPMAGSSSSPNGPRIDSVANKNERAGSQDTSTSQTHQARGNKRNTPPQRLSDLSNLGHFTWQTKSEGKRPVRHQSIPASPLDGSKYRAYQEDRKADRDRQASGHQQNVPPSSDDLDLSSLSDSLPRQSPSPEASPHGGSVRKENLIPDPVASSSRQDPQPLKLHPHPQPEQVGDFEFELMDAHDERGQRIRMIARAMERRESSGPEAELVERVWLGREIYGRLRIGPSGRRGAISESGGIDRAAEEDIQETDPEHNENDDPMMLDD